MSSPSDKLLKVLLAKQVVSIIEDGEIKKLNREKIALQIVDHFWDIIVGAIVINE